MITFLSTIAKQVIKYFSFNRGKSNNRSNDNEEEDTDWPPEELIFEYTLKHAKGKKSIPKDVMYVRFHSDIIGMDNSRAWFKDNENLEMVLLNEGLKNIGDRMFEGCELLQKITFPSTLVEVYHNAFRSSGLQRVDLNDGLEVIHPGAFVNCKSLKSIEFPSTLKRIGNTAFYGCCNLKKIVLDEGLKKIDDSAFEGCVSLESIKFPSTIRAIGAHAFDHSSAFHCRSDLKEVVFNDGLVRIGEGAFNGCRSLLSIILPCSVKYLGERSFYRCTELRKVVFNEVRTIDENAFGYCKDLKEVLFKEGLQEVGVESFSGCTSLETINFPSTLEVVGEKAFKHCKNLKEVTISDGCNLKTIGKNVFVDCDSLERISITFPRLEYLIQVGHANIINEINNIPDMQCVVAKQQHWVSNLFGRKNIAEVLITGGRWNEALNKVDQVNKLIKKYEIKEATVLIELALWKGKMGQACDAVDTSNGAYRRSSRTSAGINFAVYQSCQRRRSSRSPCKTKNRAGW